MIFFAVHGLRQLVFTGLYRRPALKAVRDDGIQ